MHLLFYVGAIVMQTVTISPKFQVVIPLAVREAMALKAGEKLRVMEYEGRIELIPIKTMRSLHGLLKGLDTTIVREADRL